MASFRLSRLSGRPVGTGIEPQRLLLPLTPCLTAEVEACMSNRRANLNFDGSLTICKPCGKPLLGV
jgi:hypothetical protein